MRKFRKAPAGCRFFASIAWPPSIAPPPRRRLAGLPLLLPAGGTQLPTAGSKGWKTRSLSEGHRQDIQTSMQALFQRLRAPPAVAGLLLQLGSSFFVSLMSIVAKLAGQMGLPVMELVLARSLVLLAVSAATLARQGADARWPWRSARRWLLLLRGCLGLGAITSLYAAVQYLPLADVATITFLAPVFVAAAAPLLLGERAGRGVALGMPLCLLGVVFVSPPFCLAPAPRRSARSAWRSLWRRPPSPPPPS
ncbi:hypothetical protein ABPG75_006323 [Micractinium tetrahymenae]